MNKLFIAIFLIFPFLSSAQQHVHKNNRKFCPHIVFNYNLHNINELTYTDGSLEPVIKKSNFVGAEIGFTLFPKTKTGYFLQYNNKLIAELGIREIYKLIHVNTGERIVDNTLSTGYFGALDAGKRFNFSKDEEFIAGIRISDKYLSGIKDYTNIANELYYDGFHLTPGIFALYRRNINRDNYFTAKFAFSHSVLNFWQYAENKDDFTFTYPFFTDVSVEFHTKSKIFIKSELNVMFPHEQIKPIYRLSLGVGYRF